MKIRLSHIILSSIALLQSCISDTHQVSSNAQQVLPGKWLIESVHFQAQIDGITYKGKTFYDDTTLLDIGEIEFGPFEFYMGPWDLPISTPIICNLKLDDENFPFGIDNLTLGDEMYGFFLLGINEGIDTIHTPGEEFILSSHIFFNNYLLFMDGERHIRMNTFASSLEVIELEKIE